MKIHGLCVVKNEADIIEQTLRAAAEWCDSIYILDNASTDGTWEKVNDLARKLPSVMPYKQDQRTFDDSIRQDIMEHYKDRATSEDWWCILDADEFYVDDPREFLKDVPRRYAAVWMQLYNYLFTDRDMACYQQNPSCYVDSVPIEDRLRYYVVGEYAEPRFFRHRKNLTRMSLREIHPIYPRRIRMKHFMYRSPEQIRKRLETRREPMLRGEFLHEKRANWVPGGVIVPGPAQPEEFPCSWKERIVSSADCHFDHGDGCYAEPSAWTPPEPPPWTSRLKSRAFFPRRLIRSVKRRIFWKSAT